MVAELNFHTGIVTFLNYSGVFSGSGFEQDLHSRLHWTDQLSPLVNLNGIVISVWQDMCFEAQQTITVGGVAPFTAMPAPSVNLVAGERILMLPGTHAQHGSYLRAWISENGYCSSLPLAMVALKEETLTPVEAIMESPDQDQFFKVYPNPTTGLFTLEFTNSTITGTRMIEIYSMIGELILSREISGEQSWQFDLADRAKGIYIVRVVQGSEMEMRKVVRQ